MTVIVQSSPTRTVVVLKQDAIGAIDAPRTVATVIDRSDVTNVAGVGIRGPRGDAGLGVHSTDDVPEGAANLYYDPARVEAVIALELEQAAAAGDGVNLHYDLVGNLLTGVNTDKGSVAVLAHAGDVDPHPQYIGPDEILDGGNF